MSLLNEKRATIKDVARLAGTSIATVSNVLNGTGRVSADTQMKVKRIMRELDYSPSTAARNLKDKRSSLIAVIVPYLAAGSLLDNPFYWQLVAGIEEEARLERLHFILVGAEPDESFAFVKERQLDGLIVIGAFKGTDILNRIQQLKAPSVFVDSYLDDDSLYQLRLDDELGGYIGTKHLLSLGHRDIALLSGELQEQGVHYYRWLGYCRALQEAGIPVRQELVLQEPVSSLSGYRAAARIVAQAAAASAVFCLSDVTAVGLMKGLHDIGLKVPGHISVMGFDNSQQASYTIPALTTVSQDTVEKGRNAVRGLIALMNGETAIERTIVQSVELVIRQSTGSKAE